MLNLPGKFKGNIRSHFPGLGEKILKAIQEDNPCDTVLINPVKSNNRLNGRIVPWNQQGLIPSVKPNFTLDPFYHAGCYYSQEASGMIMSYLMDQVVNDSSTVLDLCAAPGGKSLNILNHLANGVLIANEIDPKRNSVLQENLSKWGNSNVIITQAQTHHFRELRGFFDAVFIDAPCSGEGMFRKDPFAITQWTPDLVEQCAWQQKEILKNVFSCIKPGGKLIYSTCTLNKYENEENCKFICEKGFVETPFNFPEEWGVYPAEKGYYFLPGQSIGEGLFFACFEKIENGNQDFPKARKTNMSEVRIVLNNEEREYSATLLENTYAAMNEKTEWTYQRLPLKVKVKKAGVHVASLENGLLKPSIDIVLSDNFPFKTSGIDLSQEDILAYLQGHALSSSEKGWHSVSYSGVPLGLVKGIGKRLNNHHPKPWRIRKKL